MGSVIKYQAVFISLSEQRLPKDENDQQKLNRQREGYCITKKDATCNMSNVSCCFQLKTVLSTGKAQQKTALFCLGSFVFS